MNLQCYVQLLKTFLVALLVFLLLQLAVVSVTLYSHPTIHESSVVLKRRSLNLDAKSSLQTRVTSEFCVKRNLSHLKYQLPDHWKERTSLSRHLLVDDSNKLLFAYLPKVASSHVRRFVCVLTGVLPESTLSRQKLTTQEYRLCITNSTLIRKDLTNPDRVERLKTYWKVAILRNPFHRLVSAYRDKIIGLELKPHEREWPTSITKNFNRTVPDFESYLKWIISTPDKDLNEHFAPMVELLQPCRVDYHYYGNFKDLSHDMAQIADKLHAPKKYFLDKDYYVNAARNRTTNFLDYYFAEVSAQVKGALFEHLKHELEFYYNLFPEERNSHVRFLGVTQDVPIYTSPEDWETVVVS